MLFVAFHLLTIVKGLVLSLLQSTAYLILKKEKEKKKKQTNKKSTAYLAQFLCLPNIKEPHGSLVFPNFLQIRLQFTWAMFKDPKNKNKKRKKKKKISKTLLGCSQAPEQ